LLAIQDEISDDGMIAVPDFLLEAPFCPEPGFVSQDPVSPLIRIALFRHAQQGRSLIRTMRT
jgi:hypothetical protein